jgi:hypothetical protein
LKLCGENGHKSKAGQPCGFKIADTAFSCHHHAVDKTRQREIIDAMRVAQKQLRLPDSIDVGDLKTIEDVQKGFASVVKIAATDRHADLKRLDVIIRALNGSNTSLQTQALNDLNATIMRAEGHGPALVILEGLKTSQLRLRRLPGVAGRTVMPEGNAS